MNEKEYISILILKIAKQFDNSDAKSWVNSDFVKLSEEITEKTKIYLSPTSLKRIFGKVKYDSRPQKNTLDALAQYADYESWQVFVDEVGNTSLKIKKSKKISIKIITAIGIGAILLSYITFIIISYEAPIQYSFSFNKKSDQAPYNAIIDYDISKVKSNNCIVYFDDHFARDSADNHVLLQKGHKKITHTYQHGSIFHPKLYIDGELISSINIPIATDGWEYVMVNYNDLENSNFITIPSHIVKPINGALVIPPTMVQNYGLDTISDYWLKYRIIKDFKVDFSDLTFEIKARNQLQESNICPEIDLYILGLNNTIVYKIFKPGCGGKWTLVKMGDKKLLGEYNDLSAFGHNLDNWRTITLHTKDGFAKIFVDNELIFESEIIGDIGTFYGAIINSKGSAEFDYIKATCDSKIILNEQFE